MSKGFSYFSSRNFQSDEFKTVCFQDGSPGLSVVKPMLDRTAIRGQGRGGSGHPHSTRLWLCQKLMLIGSLRFFTCSRPSCAPRT